MISAKVDCVDVNDFSRPQTQKIFRFSHNPFSLGMLVTCWGYGCSFFFCIWAWVFSGIRHWGIGRVLGDGVHFFFVVFGRLKCSRVSFLICIWHLFNCWACVPFLGHFK
jgi:hypothetical protein